MNQGLEPVFGAAELEQIIAVAQRRFRGNMSLSLTSLERYVEGFRINLRLDWTGPTGHVPRLTWRATDAQSTSYGCLGCGGTGAGQPLGADRSVGADYAHTWRMTCSFDRAIPDDAREVLLSCVVNLSRPASGQQPDMDHPWERSAEDWEIGSFTVQIDHRQGSSS